MKKAELYNKFLIKNCATPKLSSALQDLLCDKFPITKKNAKVIISNAVKSNAIYPSIYNGNKLLFNSGEYAYSSHTGNNQYRTLLAKNKSYLLAIINKLDNNNIISYLDIAKLSGCRMNKDRKHRNIGNVINEIKFFYEIDDFTDNTQHFIIKKNAEISPSQLEQIYIKEKINCELLYCIITFIQKTNIITGRPLYRNATTPCNGIFADNCCFDASSFSSIKNVHNTKKSFTLIDFFIDEPYSDFNLYGFKERVSNVIFSTKNNGRNILGVIICRDIERTAEIEARKLGYIIIKIERVFGPQIFQLIDLLNDISIKNDISKIRDALEIINGNINLGNMKGELFERVCRDIIDKLIDKRNCIFSANKLINGIEVDYITSYDDENIFFEFKSGKYKMELGKYDQDANKYEDNTFKKTFNNFNIVSNSDMYKNRTNHLCIISANGFSDEVIEKAREQEKHYKSHLLPMLVDKNKLIELCNNSDNKKLFKHDIDVLAQYY